MPIPGSTQWTYQARVLDLLDLYKSSTSSSRNTLFDFGYSIDGTARFLDLLVIHKAGPDFILQLPGSFGYGAVLSGSVLGYSILIPANKEDEMYEPGDTYIGEFTTMSLLTGNTSNADILPTAYMDHNGVQDNTVILTVTHISTGLYTISATIPSGYSDGDRVHIRAQVTVGGILNLGIIDGFVLGGAGGLELGTMLGFAGSTDKTVGEALQAAWSQGVGNWVINLTPTPPTLTLYAPDNSTVLKSFNLTPTGGPYTSRS